MKRTHYSKRILRKSVCIKFRGRIAWQEFFFEHNFADFSYVVRVKKIKISSSCWWRFQSATSPIKMSKVNLEVKWDKLRALRFSLMHKTCRNEYIGQASIFSKSSMTCCISQANVNVQLPGIKLNSCKTGKENNLFLFAMNKRCSGFEMLLNITWKTLPRRK